MSAIVAYLFVFAAGAAVGSFLNVCIWRLPRNESIVFPASHCPKCEKKIRPLDNVPVLSYLLLGGKCRWCHERISLRYPLVELLNGLLTLSLFLKYGPTAPFLIMFVFVSSLVAVTFIDIDHQIIPDSISLTGIVAGFAASFVLPWMGWLNSLLGIAAGGGSLLLVAWLYQKLTGNEGMGGGDIKLLAMMGAFLGWRSVPFIIFAGSLLGSVVGITVMVASKKDSKLAIPFGPFLVMGALLFIFFGRPIITWYLSFGRGYGG